MPSFDERLRNIGGLDDEWLDELAGSADLDDPSLPFDRTFAGALPSVSLRSPSSGGSRAPAGGPFTMPPRGPEPMAFDLDEAETFGDAPTGEPSVMEFGLDEDVTPPAPAAAPAAPAAPDTLEDEEPTGRRFGAQYIGDVGHPMTVRRAAPLQPSQVPDPADADLSAYAEDPSIYEDDGETYDAPEVPGASRPVVTPTTSGQASSSVAVDPTVASQQRARRMPADVAFGDGTATERSDDEEGAIARGAQQDRRRRIGAGILSGLGMLMAAGGGRGAGLGMALASAGGMVGRSANREAAARAESDRRMELQGRRDDAARQAARDERDAEREEAELELRRALGESQIGVNQARAAGLQADAQTAAEDAASAQGDAAGLRSFIRARVAAMADPALRNSLSAAVGDLDSIQSVDTLRGILNMVRASDPRRGRAGAGSGGTSQLIENPDGTFSTRTIGARPTPGSNAALAEVQGAPPAEVAAIGAREARERPRRATSAAAAPAAATPEGGPRVVGTDADAFVERQREVMRELGITGNRAQVLLREIGALYQNPRTRNQAISRANALSNQLAEQTAMETAPPSEPQRARWAEKVAPIHIAYGDLRDTVGYLERNLDDLRAAMSLRGEVLGFTLTPQQRDIRARVTQRLSATISRLAGAAVSAQELERIQGMMQNDFASVARDPEGVIRNMRAEMARLEREANVRASTFTLGERRWFRNQAEGGAR